MFLCVKFCLRLGGISSSYLFFTSVRSMSLVPQNICEPALFTWEAGAYWILPQYLYSSQGTDSKNVVKTVVK